VVDGSVESTGDYVTLAQAAEAIFCSRRTIERWIARGDLAAYRDGGRVRVSATEVMLLERDQRSDARSRIHTRGTPLVKMLGLS